MTGRDLAACDATALAEAIRERHCTAREILEAFLSAISARDPGLNCFTAVTRERARHAASQVDALLARGLDTPVLAGVPYGVKNLFDIAGLTTIAGSRIRRDAPPAGPDASAIVRLDRAGAVLCGALNMDEFAYGFVTENAHDGPTHNPRDPARIAGGSSGGSAAAVAAGLLPLALGTDTNGSVRVPASLCGVFGLKGTYGRISRAGTFPFAGSFDHVGLFTRSVRDLALGFDVLHGHDPLDPVSSRRAPAATLPALSDGVAGLRIAVLDGYFAENAGPVALAAVEQVARRLRVTRRLTLPRAELARAAAYVITAAEGGQLHLADLRARAHEYDPATRDRLLAGALVPAAWVLQAQRFRAWFRERVRQVFAGTAEHGDGVDVLLTPATPCPATLIGQRTMQIAGRELPVRANLGLLTQPISFIGLPVVCVPIWPSGHAGVGLPIGVQVIAAPYREADALRIAAALEAAGLAAAPPTPG